MNDFDDYDDMLKGDSLTKLKAEAARSEGMPSRARVLSIEGSDPIGGAGTMADMKVFTAHGVYGYAVMTSVLAQNTQGVTDIVNMEPGFIRAQLDSVSDDATIDSMKIGMLGTVEIIEAVRSWLAETLEKAERSGEPKPFVVIDPVMYAKSSDALLTPDAEKALRTVLPLADVITPNIPELAALTDSSPATSWDEMVKQAKQLSAAMGIGVYAKSGMLVMKGLAATPATSDAPNTLSGPDASDVLVMPAAATDSANPAAAEPTVLRVPGQAVRTANVHGTGDSLSSSLAALRPRSDSWEQTALAAKKWMGGAIAAADRLQVGKGHGPIDFTWQKAPTGMSFASDYWHRVKPIRDRIENMRFITALVDGSLPMDNFAAYIHQDDIYLRDYSSLLALASSRADTINDRIFFAHAAESGIASELGHHHQWFVANGYDPGMTAMSETTAAYIGHEHRVADQGKYSTLAAVVMPCFWLYAEIGRQIAATTREQGVNLDEHPYGTWIRAYSDTSFDSYVAHEVEICNRLAASASIDDYEAMMEAALMSSEHEYRFFDQAADF